MRNQIEKAGLPKSNKLVGAARAKEAGCESGVDALRRLENLDWTQAIEIPAGSADRSPVRIFSNPAYFQIDHNIPLFDSSNILEQKRTSPIWYAVYAFGVMSGEDSGEPQEIRTLRFPVVARTDRLRLEDKIFGEISKQIGEDIQSLKRKSSSKKILVIAGNTAPNMHESLRMILKTQPCVKTGIDGEVRRDYPKLDSTIYSGWDGRDSAKHALINNSLVVITRPYPDVYWYIDVGQDHDILNDVAGKIMSPPLTKESVALASPEEVDLINTIVRNNTK